ncbi:hypothetical protein [Pseudomonas sp. NFX98]|uniref:hypothetical protein n=1 Tax=Pseudomonas sp. NFX98 TaxID=3399122 RepID=UPI0039FC7958
MADSKYSTVDATLNSFELSTFSVASEAFGLTGFMGALAQLGVALNAVSQDIRLLTAGQGKLGEALASLTAALSSPRSQLKAFSSVPGAGSEPAPRLNADAEPRSSSDPPRLPMVINAPNGSCNCDLTLLMHAPAVHQFVSPMALPNSEKKNGKTMETSQAAEAPKSRTPVSPDAMDASLDRLSNAVIPDFYLGLNAQVDKLSSFAEESSGKAGLAGVAVVLYSIVSKLVETVIDEAFTNVAKKILKRGASKLPLGFGKLVGEDDRGAAQDEMHRPESVSQGVKPDPGEGGAGKKKDETTRGKNKGISRLKESGYSKDSEDSKDSRNPINSKKPVIQNIEVHPRSMTSAMVQSQSLVKLVSPAQATPLLGKAATLGANLGKRAQPLRLLNAGIGFAQGVASGDTKAVVSSAGMLAGSYAGATAGAALGTLIFPGVGTAIGGLLGGFAGSELGSVLGEKLGALVDRLGAPEQVSKELTSTQTQNQPINFSPSIQVTCTATESTEQIRMVIAQQLQAQFHGEFVPLMSTNALATRRDAALTDGGM